MQPKLTNEQKKEALSQSHKREASKESIILEIARLEGEYKGTEVRLRSIKSTIERLKNDLKKYA